MKRSVEEINFEIMHLDYQLNGGQNEMDKIYENAKEMSLFRFGRERLIRMYEVFGKSEKALLEAIHVLEEDLNEPFVDHTPGLMAFIMKKIDMFRTLLIVKPKLRRQLAKAHKTLEKIRQRRQEIENLPELRGEFTAQKLGII